MLVRLFLFGLALSFLSGCATNQANVAKNYQTGKQLFLSKRYLEAFPKLLVAAQNGEAQAQYAVGYMYFYGQGVAKNQTVGHKWIAAAAEQGNPTAQKALEIIKQQKISAPAKAILNS